MVQEPNYRPLSMHLIKGNTFLFIYSTVLLFLIAGLAIGQGIPLSGRHADETADQLGRHRHGGPGGNPPAAQGFHRLCQQMSQPARRESHGKFVRATAATAAAAAAAVQRGAGNSRSRTGRHRLFLMLRASQCACAKALAYIKHTFFSIHLFYLLFFL